MAAKADAHHVVDLALMPVAGGPHAQNRWQRGLFLAHVGFDAQFRVVHEIAQMINQRPARVFAVIINAGDVHEIVEPQLGFGEAADFRDLLRVGQLDRDFAAKLLRLGD